MFLSRNKKNNVYPGKPQFYYIKVGFNGVNIILACFRDVYKKSIDSGEYRMYFGTKTIMNGCRTSGVKCKIHINLIDIMIDALNSTLFIYYFSTKKCKHTNMMLFIKQNTNQNEPTSNVTLFKTMFSV